MAGCNAWETRCCHCDAWVWRTAGTESSQSAAVPFQLSRARGGNQGNVVLRTGLVHKEQVRLRHADFRRAGTSEAICLPACLRLCAQNISCVNRSAHRLAPRTLAHSVTLGLGKGARPHANARCVPSRRAAPQNIHGWGSRRRAPASRPLPASLSASARPGAIGCGMHERPSEACALGIAHLGWQPGCPRSACPRRRSSAQWPTACHPRAPRKCEATPARLHCQAKPLQRQCPPPTPAQQPSQAAAVQQPPLRQLAARWARREQRPRRMRRRGAAETSQPQVRGAAASPERQRG